MQLTALAMLIIVLLPVVSLTDDLRLMSTPVETEHIFRRIDTLSALYHTATVPAVLLDVQLFYSRYQPHMQTFSLREPSIESARPRVGYVRQLANRPPPVQA